MIPSLWAGLHGWLLPGLQFLPGASWPWDVMQSDIFWVCVWLDEHLDIVVSYIHLGICQFQWIYQRILSSSHQWIWCTWTSMFSLWVVLLLLLPEWGVVPVRLLSGWEVLTAQFTWTTANFSHAGRPKRAGPGVSAMYQYEWIMHGWALGCLVAQRMGHRGFHTGELETHCRQLAWFIQGPGQWAGHLGWFVSDAAVGTDREVVCYLQIWCQSWHRLRQYLYCWCLQAVWWLCTLHCTAGNCSNEKVFVWGSFLCYGFGSLWFSPLFMIFETGLMMGHLWTSGITTLAFCSPVTFFPQPLHVDVTGRAVVSIRRVLMGTVGAWCIGCQWLGIMCLAGMAHSMYHMSCTHCNHSWLHSIVCSADLKQVWYSLVTANLQKLFVQLNVSIWDHLNQLHWTSNSIATSLPSLICALWASWHIQWTSSSMDLSDLFVMSSSS